MSNIIYTTMASVGCFHFAICVRYKGIYTLFVHRMKPFRQRSFDFCRAMPTNSESKNVSVPNTRDGKPVFFLSSLFGGIHAKRGSNNGGFGLRACTK